MTLITIMCLQYDGKRYYTKYNAQTQESVKSFDVMLCITLHYELFSDICGYLLNHLLSCTLAWSIHTTEFQGLNL